MLKMKFRRFYLLSLVYLITILGFCLMDVGAQKKYFGRKFSGRVIKTLVSVSLESCNDACNIRTSCRSFNYNRLKQLCELHSNSFQDKLELDVTPGYVFQEKSVENINRCSGDCPSGALCENTGNKQCEFAECWKLHVTNGITVGNMNNIGSKLLAKCHEGYLMDRRLGTAQCERSGSWDVEGEIVCKQICATPENINGGKWVEAVIQRPYGKRFYNVDNITGVLEDEILEGSSLTFSCEDDLQIYGLRTIFCEAGKWMKPPVCFYKYCGKDRVCSEPKRICSNKTCDCNAGSVSFSMKLCAETCPDILSVTTPEFDDTFNQSTSNKTDDHSNEEQIMSVSAEKCKEICLRAQDFACKRFFYRPSTVVSDNATCMLWSVNLEDRTDENALDNLKDCLYDSE